MTMLKVLGIIVLVAMAIVTGFLFLASWAINTVAAEEFEEDY